MRTLAPDLIDLYNRFHAQVDFYTIYLAEAHAEDHWPIGSTIKVNAHQTINDRLQAAQYLIDELHWPIPVYCDNMQDEFLELFAAWPLRFYIVHDYTLKYIAEPEGASFSVSDLSCALQQQMLFT